MEGRPLGERDAGSCAALHQSCFEEGWTQDAFKLLLSSKCVIGQGIWQGDTLVAALLVQNAGVSADIIIVMTDPLYRRAHLASALMRDFLKDFFDKGGESCFLEVSCDNVQAVSFYNSLNFIVCGVREEYYNKSGKMTDALIMSLSTGQKK